MNRTQKIINDLKLVVFDWDGTIMDSTARIVSAMQTSAKNVGLPVPTSEAVKGIIGLGLAECFNILFPYADSHDAIAKEYRYQYVDGDKTPSPVFDGVEKVLTELKAKGYWLAVATGKSRQGLDRVLHESGLDKFFDYTIGADEVENAKPAPDMLNVLMAKTQTKPHQVIMIGDTHFDLEMANRAETFSIGVTFGAHDRKILQKSNPFTIVCNYFELVSLFQINN